MNNYCELHLRLKLIDDLPERVDRILDMIIESKGVPENFDPPGNAFFADENWIEYFDATSSDGGLVSCSERAGRYLTINASTNLSDDFHEKKDATLNPFYLFVDWLSPYINRTKETVFIGYYLFSGDQYPVMLIIDYEHLGAVQLDKIFNNDGPVIVDPKGKSITRTPDFSIDHGTLKRLVEKLTGTTDECNDCGQCEEDGEKIPN